MAGRSASLMDGLIGKRKATRNRRISYTRPTGSRCFSSRSAKRRWKLSVIEGLVIVTTAADKGLIDIPIRLPVALTTEAAFAWLNPETSDARAGELKYPAALYPEAFIWPPGSGGREYQKPESRSTDVHQQPSSVTLLSANSPRCRLDFKDNFKKRMDTMRKMIVILPVVVAVVWSADFMGWL